MQGDIFCPWIIQIHFHGNSIISFGERMLTITAPGSISDSADCRRHIMTSTVDPRTVRVKIFIIAETHNIGIQMKQKELTKTFLMIFN